MTQLDALELVDRDRLARFLGRITPIDGEIDVDLLSGGRSNLTFLVRSGEHEYVVRRRPLGQVPAGAHDMAREHRVLAALQGTSIPVPDVFGFSDDDTIVGAPFYVMSRVRGSILERRNDASGLSPSQSRQISCAVVDILDQLHRIDPKFVGLGDFGRPGGFVARRVGRWLDQWRRGPHRDHPLVEDLGSELAAEVPEQADTALVHGDFRLGNMLVAASEPAGDTEGEPAGVNAVLDWELSTLGDPLTDLAHLLVYWAPTRGRTTHESQTIAEHPGFLTSTELADQYAGATGRDLAQLDFYLAFEHWRAAIIKEAIFMRESTKAEAGDAGDELGDSVGRHLEEATDLLGSG